MRPSVVSRTLVLITSFISSSNALYALEKSPCATQCGNVLGSTSGSELVCFDSGYGSTYGTVFSGCLNCQLGSTFVDPTTQQTDLEAALYNLRYALSWCLFAYPNSTTPSSTPCTTKFACGPMESAFEFDSLSLSASEYGYCPLIPSVNGPKCTSCLSVQNDQFYLNNFFTVLEAACQQQPSPGTTVSIVGSIFSKTSTNITVPSTTLSSTYTPHKGLSVGVIVAIAIGGLLLLLLVAGVCTICIGRRRRRKAIADHQRRTGYATWLSEQQSQNQPMQFQPPDASSGGGQVFHDSPASQRPLVSSHPWGPGSAREDESPASAMGDKAYFSPYSSQWSSPVSAQEIANVRAQEWPGDRKGSIGHNVPIKLERSRSTEKRFFPEDDDGDRIELQNVAPVLLHPGHGRGGGGLNNYDARQGHAV